MIEKLGLKRRNWEDIAEERDQRMRSQYIDPIENFPDKVDQLLEELTRVNRTKKGCSFSITIFVSL